MEHHDPRGVIARHMEDGLEGYEDVHDFIRRGLKKFGEIGDGKRIVEGCNSEHY
jgi:hypothetical protein